MPPGVEGQDGPAEVDAADLGDVRLGQPSLLALGPEPDAAAGPRPARPPGPLVGGGPADPAEFESVEAAGRVVARVAGQAAVDHGRHALDGQRGLGDVGRQHDLASVAGPNRRLLLLEREGTVERQDPDPLATGPGGQLAGRPADLLDPRQEREHVAARGLGFDRPGDLDGQRLARRAPIGHLDRVRPPLDPDDRRVAQELRDRPGVHRRRHHDQDQVVADRLADLAEHRQGQVGVQAPLVELVEDHGADAFEEGVAHELTVEDALGHDPDSGLGADPPLEPDLIADPPADRPAVLLGDPAGGGPGGDPPGLEHHQVRVLGRQEPGPDQGDRHPRRLAGAGRGDEHQAASIAGPVDDLGEGRVDRQGDHETSVWAGGRGELARSPDRMLSLSNSAGNPTPLVRPPAWPTRPGKINPGRELSGSRRRRTS